MMQDTIITDGSKTYIMFQAVPDSGDVVISKDAVAILQYVDFNWANSPRLAWKRGILTIDRGYFTNPKVTVTILDLTGKVVRRYILETGVSKIPITGSAVARSAFIAKVSSGDRTSSGIFIPQL